MALSVDPMVPASGEVMTSPDQWQYRDFSGDFLAALGRMTVSYAELEKTRLGYFQP